MGEERYVMPPTWLHKQETFENPKIHPKQTYIYGPRKTRVALTFNFAALWCHRLSPVQEGWDVQLHYMGFSVLALAPLQLLGQQRLAIFGLAGLWNPTGSVAVEAVEGRLPLGGVGSEPLLMTERPWKTDLGSEMIYLSLGSIYIYIYHISKYFSLSRLERLRMAQGFR
jgi:hypothetical protein